LCEQHNALLILDEIQSGMGRTGALFSYMQKGIVPDILTSAKGLGGGFPIGGILVNEKIEKAFEPGNHASTFGGNALACAAANAVLSEIENKNLLANVHAQGKLLYDQLTRLKEKHACVKDVRGIGLMLGMELNVSAKEIISKCIDKGLLIVNAGENILRFVPPLIVSCDEIMKGVKILDEALGE